MRISILIPCYNEEKTIKACVESCLNQTLKADEVVVVNDGSTDKSKKILEEFGNKIKLVDLKENTGNKSRAQETGLDHITGDIVVTTDADTVLDKNFLAEIAGSFIVNDAEAVAGYVKSLKNNWLTGLRELDYLVGQDLHRNAQSEIGCLFVIPGCAAAYKSELFKRALSFDHDTVTEDIDLTYKLHKYGKRIIFNKRAVVYTQDPSDLYSFVNQLRRWYGGQWQNLVKHAKAVKRPMQVLEYAIIHSEGIYAPVSLIVLPFIDTSIAIFNMLFLFSYSLAVGLYAAILRRRSDLFLYAPLYFISYLINSYVFIEQFVKEYIFRRKSLYWFKPARRSIA